MRHADLIQAVRGPLLLNPNNFTPLSRTPWAGSHISDQYKKDILSPVTGQRVGESWEFSCDPSMPSSLREIEISLPELIDQMPGEILSPEFAAGVGCEILVKLLNADHPLSFQVHPEDEDPDLKATECGKPESWLVLDAKPGAGIYLGFRKGLTKDVLQQKLLAGSPLTEDLFFVPVRANDYFDIAPGVPHAIGPGVTLLEPQRIQKGKSGKTYRLWDWNRRYFPNGTISDDPELGSPRELHIEACLRLIRPEIHCGSDFVNTLRRIPEEILLASGGRVLDFPANPWYRTQRVWPGVSPHHTIVRLDSGFGVLVVLKGDLTIESEFGVKKICRTGQPVLLPWQGKQFRFSGTNSHCNFALICPANGRSEWLG